MPFSPGKIKWRIKNLKGLWAAGIPNYKFIVICAFKIQCSFPPDSGIKLLKDSELDFINWTETKDKKGRTLSSVGKGKYISGLLFNRRLKIFPKCVLSLLKNVDDTLRY